MSPAFPPSDQILRLIARRHRNDLEKAAVGVREAAKSLKLIAVAIDPVHTSDLRTRVQPAPPIESPAISAGGKGDLGYLPKTWNEDEINGALTLYNLANGTGCSVQDWRDVGKYNMANGTTHSLLEWRAAHGLYILRQNSRPQVSSGIETVKDGEIGQITHPRPSSGDSASLKKQKLVSG